MVKFIGGVIAIGGGLVLGREGPTVQMGSGIGDLVGRAFRRSDKECRLLLAAGAGAGLATAFNAPNAGAIFVLDDVGTPAVGGVQKHTEQAPTPPVKAPTTTERDATAKRLRGPRVSLFGNVGLSGIGKVNGRLIGPERGRLSNIPRTQITMPATI